jgi:hypothetical protein
LAGDLRYLASAAASTLVALMATDAWPQARNSVADFWLRYQPPYLADRSAADLEGANATVARARQVKDRRVENAVAAEWEGRILALLMLEPAAAADLAAVMGRLQPQGAQPSGRTGFHARKAAGAGSARTPRRSIRVPIAVVFLIVPIFLVFGVLGITGFIHEGLPAPVPPVTGSASATPSPLPSSDPGSAGSAPATLPPTTTPGPSVLPSSGSGSAGSAPATPSARTTRGPWTEQSYGVVVTVESVTRQEDPSQQGVERLVVPIDVTSVSDLLAFDVTVLDQAGNSLYPDLSQSPSRWNREPPAGINVRSVLVFAADPSGFPTSLTMTFRSLYWAAGQRIRIDVPVPR